MIIEDHAWASECDTEGDIRDSEIRYSSKRGEREAGGMAPAFFIPYNPQCIGILQHSSDPRKYFHSCLLLLTVLT